MIDQALTAFNTTSSLTPPTPSDITLYRDYLHTAHPIAEMETRFLDPADDLVSVCSSLPASVAPSQSPSQTPSQTQTLTQASYLDSTRQPEASDTRDAKDTADVADIPDAAAQNISASAIAVAVAVLVPILTFPVIPGFLGRLAVTSLVAAGVIVSLVQAGVLIAGQLLETDGLLCGGIYFGGMVLIATIMS